MHIYQNIFDRKWKKKLRVHAKSKYGKIASTVHMASQKEEWQVLGQGEDLLILLAERATQRTRLAAMCKIFNIFEIVPRGTQRQTLFIVCIWKIDVSDRMCCASLPLIDTRNNPCGVCVMYI